MIKTRFVAMSLGLVGCLMLISAPAFAALPESQRVGSDPQLEQLLDSVESQAIEDHAADKKRLRGATIPLQGIIEDKILSANKRVVLSPRAILSAIEEELAKGSDKGAISNRLVSDFGGGRYFAK